ncbi:DUF3486 family protein [Polaromonas sp. JS666]|uniref:DUF3486 family protein n=1 Tax=Polaromonas sp. (strain JS666 / ATCC BAA-500) TaxID=296591 RepID=UPI0000464B3A|nr:DUF3486 family protein [Polaromonas sp. JS666]ABE45680.1 conserved hypothetical phage-related protein [Polaromonas sp. JS666]
MTQRSKVVTLPEATRAELDRRLITEGFRGYDELELWLRELGYEIGKSSIHRYGTKLEQRLDQLKRATDQAKALVAAAPDDAGDMSQAVLRLMQEKIFSALMEMEVDPDEQSLGGLAKALAPLVRANIAQQKFASEVKEKARSAAEAVDKLARKGGLTDDTVDAIRRQILGIAA